MLIFSAGWSAVALGSNSSLIPCDNSVRALTTSLEIADSLTVRQVEHVNIEQLKNESQLGLNQPVLDVSEATAPLLFLTPRVSTILRNVFTPGETVQLLNNANDRSSSPLADSIAESTLADPEDSVEIALPRLQRQMFRTDI